LVSPRAAIAGLAIGATLVAHCIELLLPCPS
jgi:hypothetical protein